MNCHVQVLAHPAKMEGARRGHAPTLEDIAGAKHWDNVVHRPLLYEKGAIKTQTDHRKARFEELGHPCKLFLDFKIKEGKYVSVDYDV
jgi:twinkle protein